MTDINGVKNDVVQKGIEVLGDKVFKIIRFGSYARGDFEEDSDVDILPFYQNIQKDGVVLYEQC